MKRNQVVYLSLTTLSEMFELPPPVVHRILSKMMISEELQVMLASTTCCVVYFVYCVVFQASWDEPTQTVTLHHAEPTRLQSLALQLSEKVP